MSQQDMIDQVYEQCAAIATALLARYRARAGDGPAHVVIGDDNYEQNFLQRPIEQIGLLLAWRCLLATQAAATTLVEFPQQEELMQQFRRRFDNYPGRFSDRSNEELAAILGALLLIDWLQENNNA